MVENKNQRLCLRGESETEQCFIEKRVVNDGIFLYYQQKHRKFMYKDMLWIEASGSYCSIRMADQKQIVFVYTLHQLYEKLPKERFARIHRSYIVNLYTVTSFLHKMLYVGEKMLPISSPYLKEVMSCFNCVNNRKILAEHKKQEGRLYAENE